MNWWWLSFSDPNKPAGQRFLGVVILEGESVDYAARRAWRLGLNPGGEVLGFSIDDRLMHTIPITSRERLLTWAECEVLDEAMVRSTLN